MAYSEKFALIRKLAFLWLHNYHWNINQLIDFSANNEEFTRIEREFILAQNVEKPYNKLIRFETCIFREVLVILPISGIEYSCIYASTEN